MSWYFYGKKNYVWCKDQSLSMMRGFSQEYMADRLNITQATEFIEKDLPDTEEKTEILRFIRDSKRGILKVSAKEISDEY